MDKIRVDRRATLHLLTAQGTLHSSQHPRNTTDVPQVPLLAVVVAVQARVRCGALPEGVGDFGRRTGVRDQAGVVPGCPARSGARACSPCQSQATSFARLRPSQLVLQPPLALPPTTHTMLTVQRASQRVRALSGLDFVA